MAGRPTDYKTEYTEQAEKLCKLGFTDADLADFFEVSESTINLWKKKHPEFSESVKKGKVIADMTIAESLFERAKGCTIKTQKAFKIKIGDGVENVVVMDVLEGYPPDTTAAIFWLKNRQKKLWRDKVEHGITDGEGNDVPPVTIFQIPDNGRSKNNPAPRGVSGKGA